MTNSSNLDQRGSAAWRASLQGKPRQRRDQRPSHPKGMYFTESDRRILLHLYAYRILSQPQFERLLNRARGTVQEKLMRLYHHGFLDRLFLPVRPGIGRSPTLYVLDRRGMDFLRGEGMEEFAGFPKTNVSSFFLEHTLAINDVRIAITLAAQALGWTVLTWVDENQLKRDYEYVAVRTRRGKPRALPIVPDSYFALDIPERGTSHFFLELDRGTMTQDRFKQKVIAYVHYLSLDSGKRRYQAKGLRVLTVTDKAKRLPKLVETTITVPGVGRRFWFASLAALTPDSILAQPVWTVTGSGEPSPLFSI